MGLSQTDVGHMAEFGRRMAKGPGEEVIVTEAFKTLTAVAKIDEMRIVYAPNLSSWHDWKAANRSIEVRQSEDWPSPARNDLTVRFDSDAAQSGFVSVGKHNVKAVDALQILAPEIWSALLLRSALAMVQKASISEAELVRQTLRARDEERRLIARELHDDLGQSMASLKLCLKWSEDQISHDQAHEEVVVELSKARESVGEMLGKIRDLSHMLYPRILDSLGLVSAVKELAHQVGRHSPVVVECTTRGTQRPLSKEAAVCLYRCCQEAISNVIRHADASQLAIEIHFTSKEIRVTVEDNGRGFNPRTFYDSANRLMSSGFWTIRQRVADLGGAFRVSTAERQGTVIEMIVPYSSRKTNAKRKDKTAHS